MTDLHVDLLAGLVRRQPLALDGDHPLAAPRRLARRAALSGRFRRLGLIGGGGGGGGRDGRDGVAALRLARAVSGG